MTLQEARERIVEAQPDYTVSVSATAWAHRDFGGRTRHTDYMVCIQDPRWDGKVLLQQSGSDLSAMVTLACAFRQEADEPVEAVEERGK